MGSHLPGFWPELQNLLLVVGARLGFLPHWASYLLTFLDLKPFDSLMKNMVPVSERLIYTHSDQWLHLISRYFLIFKAQL